MNKFSFKYPVIVWVLLGVVLVLLITGLTFNVLDIIYYFKGLSHEIFTPVIFALLTAFLCVLVVSLLLYGKYTIKNQCLYTHFGLLSNKVNIQEVVQITHFKKSDKLVVYFFDQTFTVIVISNKDYERFILEMRKINPSILFSTEIDGEDTPK